MSTAAQMAANQANAQLSTGPSSESGKSKSSLNAVKTGLTGRTVLLPGDDAAAYQAHLARFTRQFEPLGEPEQNLVQSLADTEWRLLRIPSLEMGIYSLARLEFAELFPEEDEAVRNSLIQAKTFLTYQKQLNNLSVQEGRLRRQWEKDSVALRDARNLRVSQTEKRLTQIANIYIEHVEEDREFNEPEIGFEFTMEQIEVRALEIKPNLFAHCYDNGVYIGPEAAEAA